MRADPRRGGPPRLAKEWIATRLPGELGEAIAGDLEEEYRTRILPSYSRLRADLWFWWQTLTLRVRSLRRAERRVGMAQPTRRHVGGGHAQDTDPDIWSRFSMIYDHFRQAARRLVRRPAFTAVAILSLAIGIGANTAMFSIVNAVLIRQLPVSEPERLVEIYTSDSDGFPHATSSQPDYLDLRAEADAFESVIGTRTFIARMDDEGAPRVVFGELISWDYFQTLGVPMALGRTFAEEEDRIAGTHPVAILGHRTWTQDFASNRAIVGQDVYLNGRPYTIVGVAPESFTGSMPVMVTSFYVPLMMTDEIMGAEQLSRRGSRSMLLKGRLRTGVGIDQANASLLAVSEALQERYPDTNENRIVSALPSGDVALHPLVDRMLTPVAALLLAVVGLVLLIACVNLASFLLARAEDRRKEVAIRLALGAGRQTLMRQLLAEPLLLAVMGGVVGLVVAQWTIGLLTAFQPPLPVPISFDIPLDRTVLMFTGAVSLLAGLAFGLVPALQASNPEVAPTLKNEGIGSGTRQRQRLRGMLVVAQVAFSFVLLIGAGLFIRSLQQAQTIDPGFDTGPAALVWPMPELSGYETPEAVRDFLYDYEEKLLAHPAITHVAQADRLPLGVAVQTGGFVLPGVPSESLDGVHDIDNATVNAGYFEAMGVDIIEGRAFERSDLEGAPIVIVSRAFVDRFYPGGGVVGSVIQSGGEDLQIVGIAADTKVRTLGEAPRPYVYELQGQEAFFGMQFVIRGVGTSEELVSAARQTLDQVGSNIVLFEEPKSMNDHLGLLLFAPRMAALLLTVFGGLALFLSAIGIYGVVNYAVSARTRELGIRISLGATGRDIVHMAIGGGMRLVIIGAAVGTVLSAAVTWSISGYLYGVSTRDLGTFVAIPLVLCGVALLAAYLPARRARRVDPVGALRSE